MRVLVLCKRQYTGRDLLDDRFGRLFELPRALGTLGHQVGVVATSYRRRGPVNLDSEGVRWRGVDALPWPCAVSRVWRDAADSLNPDVIVGSSDAIHLVAAARLGRMLRRPVILDLYDDYEAFSLTRIPGLSRLLRQACMRADAVLAVGSCLAGIAAQRGVDPARVHVLGNGVPRGFVPDATRVEARAHLGLPIDAPLVGTIGALDSSRGVEDLFAATRALQLQRPDLRMVLAGRLPFQLRSRLPAGSIDLGERSHTEVGLLLRALDVGVVCNRDTAFAHACHPMKLVEMAACGTPVVAADVGEVSVLLREDSHARYRPGDVGMLAERLAGQLDDPRPLPSGLALSWDELGERLHGVLDEVVAASRQHELG